MTDVLLETSERLVTPVHALKESDLEAFLKGATPFVSAFAGLNEFKAKSGQVLMVPNDQGLADQLLMGLGSEPKAQDFRGLPSKLPPGDYLIATAPAELSRDQIALAFALGSYKFDRYKTRGAERPRLVCPDIDRSEVLQIARACALARDMINTPANDLGPLQIETLCREVAHQQGAHIEVVTGDSLLEANYPAVHAVGRAAAPDRAPRMIEITWGNPEHPVVAIVGKGVTFDTGGLDIKPSASMRQMKKDMGGAAHALALSQMIMTAKLPVRLVVLIPAVENAISADAMRPGDILASRKGLTIEVGNTDAEGRLILADALTRACELEPVLTLDLATLTGAARVALGPQLPPFYTDDEDLAAQIEIAMRQVDDPMWRLPLWKGYVDSLDSDVADIKNDPDAWAQAGSVTAALFLQRFAPKGAWAHFDIFAWNPRARAGWPAGAEAQAIRALYRMIAGRFS